MGIVINPSDLKFKYPRDVERKDQPKFSGKPDPAPFNRHDLYEVLAMLAAVMDELQTNDGVALHMLEDILNEQLPTFISSREDVFDYLVGMARERLEG